MFLDTLKIFTLSDIIIKYFLVRKYMDFTCKHTNVLSVFM